MACKAAHAPRPNQPGEGPDRSSVKTEKRAKKDLQGPDHKDWCHLCLQICLLLSPLPPGQCLRSQLFTPRGPFPPKATSSSCKISTWPKSLLPPRSLHLVVYTKQRVPTSSQDPPHITDHPGLESKDLSPVSC